MTDALMDRYLAQFAPHVEAAEKRILETRGEWLSHWADLDRQQQIAARKARAAEFRKAQPRKRYKDL